MNQYVMLMGHNHTLLRGDHRAVDGELLHREGVQVEVQRVCRAYILRDSNDCVIYVLR